MKTLSLSAIISTILTIGTLAGGMVAIEERYAHASELRNLRAQVQVEMLENKLDRIQDRIWRQDDRGYKSQADIENKRRLEAEKTRTEQQLQQAQQKLLKEQ